ELLLLDPRQPAYPSGCKALTRKHKRAGAKPDSNEYPQSL
ncbi:hypothetical protein AVEN_176007-2-1, partial [Araneus ventricosus]